MKLLADENLYGPIIEYLRNKGNDVLSVRESGLSGATDINVYELAVKENRVIVTMDKDFTKITRFNPGKCGGIIVAKIYNKRVAETLGLFKKHLESITEEYISGNLVVITSGGIRRKIPLP